MVEHVIFSSYGNDSVALIQFAHERNLEGVHILYSNTQWAADWWPARVRQAELWAASLGFSTHTTNSLGMEGVVTLKKAWPRGGGRKYQFCTQILKKDPALAWLEGHDPLKNATCMTGVRREESAHRHDAPEYVLHSDDHGGRELWQPLVRHTAAERDALVRKSPLPLLPFRSKECYPCVNARVGELRTLPETMKAKIRAIESSAGVNSKGNARAMFSPKKYGGAIGIDAVVNYCQLNTDELFDSQSCASGWCGG